MQGEMDPIPDFVDEDEAPIVELNDEAGECRRLFRSAATGAINHYLLQPALQCRVLKQLIVRRPLGVEDYMEYLVHQRGVFVEHADEQDPAVVCALSEPQQYDPWSSDKTQRELVKMLLGTELQPVTDLDRVQSDICSFERARGRTLRDALGVMLGQLRD